MYAIFSRRRVLDADANMQLGKILVIHVEDLERKPGTGSEGEEEKPPLMLAALNATNDMEWSELQAKVSHCIDGFEFR